MLLLLLWYVCLARCSKGKFSAELTDAAAEAISLMSLFFCLHYSVKNVKKKE
jgi:hypothetical protein